MSGPEVFGPAVIRWTRRTADRVGLRVWLWNRLQQMPDVAELL